MSRITYTQDLDRFKLLKPNLKQMFDDAGSSINAGFSDPDFLPYSIKPRHIGNQVRPHIRREFKDNVNIVPGVAFNFGGYGDFHEVNHSRLTFDVNVVGVKNRDGKLAQSWIVYAVLRTNGATLGASTTNFDAHGGTVFCLGYSTNGAVSWAPVEESVRPAMQMCGQDLALFGPQQQTHYMNGTAGWYPPSEPLGSRVVLVGAFGGTDVPSFGPTNNAQTFVSVFTNTDCLGPGKHINLRGYTEARFRNPLD